VHISTVNCAEIIKDRPGQFAYKMFSIERTFKHFNRLSFDLLGLRSLPYGGVKFGYSYKHALLFSFHAVE